jgi:hypothetical protein
MSTLVALIAAEVGFRPHPVGWVGECPSQGCGGTAFAWELRVGRAPDSWRCTRCLEGGTMLNLHHRAPLHGRATA